MDDRLTTLFDDVDRGALSRRQLLQALGLVAAGVPLAKAVAQGRCMRTFGIPSCNTTEIKPLFDPTGWRTTSLDHVTMLVADYQKEAAFYNALVGWKQRSDDGTQAIMDIGDWGTVILKNAPASSFEAPAARGGGGGAGRGGEPGANPRGPVTALVTSFCFGVANWNAKKVEADLRARGLAPVADNDGKFESFHVKDPDGWDLQISNGVGAERRRAGGSAKLAAPLPFAATGWKTVWLDHFSFSCTNYKESVSFYTNLLGWKPTYDEGSQNELMIADIGDIIIRGGNPLDPNFGRGRGRGNDTAAPPMPTTPPPRRARIDHISFGIQPWDTDKVKEGLESRGLRAQVDTSTGDEIHVAAFKSYHTATPNGYNLQISAVTHDTRLTLPDAVRPKPKT
ncbi:MAG TPA: VOC family protein [Gemmatimonadaceae bacterium]|jgi:catechol 2,3-dioxygenase-like lactoylglutathione lyase family enzyme